MFGGRKKLVMCQACRGLIEPSTRVCPLCGLESVPAPRAGSVDKPGMERFFSRLVLTINIALYVMMLMVDMKMGSESALQGPSDLVFLDFGGLLTVAVANGEWWRLVTANFIHLGIIHIMFNSLALYQIGPLVEEIYGSQKFIFIYVATGLFSCICSYAVGINGAGASGAIFGLIGLMAVYGYRLGGSTGRALMRQMLIWAAFAIIVTFSSANQVAHIGGFIAGAVMGFLIRGQHPATSRESLGWNVAAIASALLVVISFVMVAAHYGESQRWLIRPQFQARNQSVNIEATAEGQYTPKHWNRISASKNSVSARGAGSPRRQTTSNAPTADSPRTS
ncbi:MAG TPA: rhomboid family intramembrane serine protease [Blastocatellia bacterium]|nr:rhomboid family intramembrane serine protease [Blastocatellia bacterium]